MGKSYSRDLRERVVERVVKFIDWAIPGARGRQVRGVAELCRETGVSAAKDRVVAPAKRGRPRGSGKLAKHRDFRIGHVKQRPDLSMPELAALLQAERGVRASPASLSRFLCKAGYSYKKRFWPPSKERPDVKQAPRF